MVNVALFLLENVPTYKSERVKLDDLFGELANTGSFPWFISLVDAPYRRFKQWSLSTVLPAWSARKWRRG